MILLDIFSKPLLISKYWLGWRISETEIIFFPESSKLHFCSDAAVAAADYSFKNKNRGNGVNLKLPHKRCRWCAYTYSKMPHSKCLFEGGGTGNIKYIYTNTKIPA